MNKRRALISVSDKRGAVELARGLIALGFEIISTGGTAKSLVEAGLAVTPVAEVTGFPEILGGRVKTLNPRIHAGILARLDDEEQRQELEKHGVTPIELVAVNLYPFAAAVARPGAAHEDAVENIDIGGPAMVRAAAKNHASVTVVVNPDRYPEILAQLESNGSVGDQTRLKLAAEAFAHTAAYDAMIASYFTELPGTSEGRFPKQFSLSFNKMQELRYGENPQQDAVFYAQAAGLYGLAGAKQLQGKELSFNNLNDLHAARELALEFDEPVAVAVKHANPCGVGRAESIAEAYRLAFRADPVSIFGGIIALNREVDEETARQMAEIFLEAVIAPAFSPEALKLLKEKSDLRLLQAAPLTAGQDQYDLKKVDGGLLLQTIDRNRITLKEAKPVTGRKPGIDELEMLLFAQKVVKHVRSNAIVVGGRNRTFGIGAGQMSRIAAAKIALAQAGDSARGAVIGSDAFFPFPDTVEEAAAAGITAIVQPGGSLKDAESIEACNRHGITMIFTGRRYFKH